MADDMKTIIADLKRLHGELDVQIDELRATPRFIRSFKCPLDFYERRDRISPEQHSAGMALASLYFQAFGKSGSVQGNYQPRSGGRKADWFNPAVWKYLKAYRAINGWKEREVCIRVCCYDLKAGKDGDMAYLRSALDDLAVHFRR